MLYPSCMSRCPLHIPTHIISCCTHHACHGAHYTYQHMSYLVVPIMHVTVPTTHINTCHTLLYPSCMSRSPLHISTHVISCCTHHACHGAHYTYQHMSYLVVPIMHVTVSTTHINACHILLYPSCMSQCPLHISTHVISCCTHHACHGVHYTYQHMSYLVVPIMNATVSTTQNQHTPIIIIHCTPSNYEELTDHSEIRQNAAVQPVSCLG